MERPQIRDGGMVSNIEGRFEYIELIDAHNLNVGVLHVGCWVMC